DFFAQCAVFGVGHHQLFHGPGDADLGQAPFLFKKARS
ncbi:hypothetical protein PSYJA_45366, partial [Pseudomonas syringae pv. japonica str. M301072]